ncbi:uncharacterized protein AB675_2613 [Cyphellophora attinorum]|uniref:Transcription factor domain-containing protein n=1 Tax=Cyphellophora attinorum TaxID=1664694 RepID=A0A0N0NRH0_9EURO|nr:uncharacterized protein AB675_2613 [Phialophora attinorum]KPI44839.1 hypothetical protein AB675_2613 [Phialophora attinorum]
MATLTRQPLLQLDSSMRGPVGPLVQLFDRQICQIANEQDPRPNPFKVLMARLHVCCFYFLGGGDALQHQELINVFQIACAFVDALSDGDAATGFILYSPHINYRTIVLSAFIILRVLRSILREVIDVPKAEGIFLAAIELLDKRSLTRNDLEARNAAILRMLWDSSTALRQSDGTCDGLRTRSMARGSFSVAFDCYYYWIRELHSQSSEPTTAGPNVSANGATYNGGSGEIVAPTTEIPPPPQFDFGPDMFGTSEATLMELFGLSESFDGWNTMDDYGDLLQ